MEPRPREQGCRELDHLLAAPLACVGYNESTIYKRELLARIQRELPHPAQFTEEELAAPVYGEAMVVTGSTGEKGISKGKPINGGEAALRTRR